MRLTLRVLMLSVAVVAGGCASTETVFVPGNDVTYPVVVSRVSPSYTQQAIRAGIEGEVWMECLVRPDGLVGDVIVTRSLDEVHGLDSQAIQAAQQWVFKPGMRNGKPVPVRVGLAMKFSLRDSR